jgi:transposase
MVRRKSLKAQELDLQVTEAVLGVQSGKYKSANEAAKVLGLSQRTVLRRVNGGLTHIEARHKQQLLSKTQEKTLLRWIKELTISGYAPSHRILREVADEIRTSQNRIFD